MSYPNLSLYKTSFGTTGSKRLTHWYLLGPVSRQYIFYLYCYNKAPQQYSNLINYYHGPYMTGELRVPDNNCQ